MQQDTIPTLFNEIQFFEADHTYKYHGRPLLSVTQFLKRFYPPFDQRAVAERVVAKKGGEVEALIREWNRSSEKAMALGTTAHQHIANILTEAKTPPNGQMIPSEVEQFLNLWVNRLRITHRVSQVEWVVGDDAWGIAGTIDALLYLDGKGTYHLFDWKTGKFELTNRYGKTLRGPFGYLDDCQFNRYSLQLSLYRLILERNTTMNLGDSYIVHLMPDDSEIYPALDLREPLAGYLNRPSPVLPASINV